jgi:hypothetical protein
MGEVTPLGHNHHDGGAVPTSRSTAAVDYEWQPVYAPTNNYNSKSHGHRRRGFQNHDTVVDHLLPIYGDDTNNNGDDDYDPNDYKYDDDTRQQQPDKRSYWNRFQDVIVWPITTTGRRLVAWAKNTTTTTTTSTSNNNNNNCTIPEGTSITFDQASTICSPINHSSAVENSYYEDTYNDETWTCSFGTEEDVSSY